MANIRIRVGASLDSDLANVFRPLRDEARRARSQVAQDQRATDKQAAAASLAIWRDQYKENSRLNREMFKAQVAAAKDAAKQSTSVAAEGAKRRTAIELAGLKEAAAQARAAGKQQNRERLSDFEATVREMTRMEARAQRDRVRAGMGIGGRGGGGGGFYGGHGGFVGYLGGRHVVQGAGRDFGRIMRGAGHMLGDVGRGLGVEFDVSSMVRRNTDLARKSQEVANAGYQPGVKGPAGTRVAGATMEEESRKVAEKWGLVTTEVADAHKEFVNITGDLQTSRDLMGDLGKMSAATGAELGHLAGAAAKIAVQMPNGPDKNAKILEVMRATLAQGKLGGAELDTVSQQMPKLMAASTKFGGDKVQMMKLMGILFQEAIQTGGAARAPQAGTSITSFTSLFSKPARLKMINAAIGRPRDDTGFLKNPEELIAALLRKTGGREERLAPILGSVMAARAVGGFQSRFLQASGGKMDKESLDKGVVAVREEFKRLGEELENNAEIEKAAALRMDQADKKAMQFQAALDRITHDIVEKVYPALAELAPQLLKAAQGFGKIVEWVAGNPFQAIFGALAASILKAGIGEVIARALGISVAGQLAGMGAGGVGAAGATAGLGGLVGTMGLAAVSIGALGLAADQAWKLWQETHRKTVHGADMTDEEAARVAKMTPEERRKWMASGQAARANVATLNAAGVATGEAGAKVSGPPTQEVAAAISAEKIALLTEEQVRLMRANLKVHIENWEDFKPNPGGDNMPPQPGKKGTVGFLNWVGDNSVSSENTKGYGY